ncbi:MAG TPA: thioesterase family protein [Planctomycetota bacterium]
MESPSVPPAEAMRFRVVLRTRWVDDDRQGVLNNAVYLTLMEEARLAYCGELGLMAAEGAFPFVLAQTNVAFLRPGLGGVQVEVQARTLRLGETSFLQAYRIVGPGGETWCEARARLVAWDPVGRCKRPLTAAFRASIEAFEGLPERSADGSEA